MTYQDRQDLPPTQATLYRTALEILLHRWAAERRVHNEPVYAELTAELEVDMLAEMAAELFREQLHPLLAQTGTKIIVDLSDSPRINSEGIAPQFTGRKGPSAREPSWWISRATSSLPAPDSPQT